MTFTLNIQTLNMNTSAVVASAALVYFDETTRYSEDSHQELYDMLFKDSILVNFNVEEQHAYRTIDPETVNWWTNVVPKEERSVNFKKVVTPNFVTIGKLRMFIEQYCEHGSPKMCFTKNPFHRFCFDSFCVDTNVATLFKFSEHFDMRTAELMLLDTTWTETTTLKFNKYNPRDNCILDAMKLILG